MSYYYEKKGPFTTAKVVMLTSFIIILGVVGYYKKYILDQREGPEYHEAEVKARCHTIQIALERYCTDNGEYPPYLFGGDQEGWNNWHAINDGANVATLPNGRTASNSDVNDPLIKGGYLYSYPYNPFMTPESSAAVVSRTNMMGTGNPGDGDPRFGIDGHCMGNGLDDPAYFAGSLRPDPQGWSTVETRRTLDRGVYMHVPDEFKYSGSSAYYCFGGRYNTETPEPDDTVMTYWPGNFFYRAIGDQLTSEEIASGRRYPCSGAWGNPQVYILGGYGKEGNEGMDVIRLEPFNSEGERVEWILEDVESGPFYLDYGYRDEHEDRGGLPEVFGGGGNDLGPTFPYHYANDTIMFGAPDGIPDGVIIVLTSADKESASRRKQYTSHQVEFYL